MPLSSHASSDGDQLLTDVTSLVAVPVALVAIALVTIPVALIAIALIGIALVSVALASISASVPTSTTCSSIRNHQVPKSSLNQQIKLAQTRCIQGLSLRLRAQGRNSTIGIDSRINQGRDAPELRGGRERWIRAHLLRVSVRKGVRVFLGGDVGDGCVDGVLAAAEGGDDLIGGAKLGMDVSVMGNENV